MDTDYSECPRPITTILIVDDFEPARRLMADAFCKDSYQILESKALATGIRRAQKYKPHCVLLDLNLPDSKGINTIKHFMAALPDSTIVVITGEHGLGKECVQAGAQDYLDKPFSPAQLVERVELAIARSAVRPYSQAFAAACDRVLATLDAKQKHDSGEALKSSKAVSSKTTLIAV